MIWTFLLLSIHGHFYSVGILTMLTIGFCHIWDGINDKLFALARYYFLSSYIIHPYYLIDEEARWVREEGRTERRRRIIKLCSLYCIILRWCCWSCWGESTSNNSIPAFPFLRFSFCCWVDGDGVFCAAIPSFNWINQSGADIFTHRVQRATYQPSLCYYIICIRHIDKFILVFRPGISGFHPSE